MPCVHGRRGSGADELTRGNDHALSSVVMILARQVLVQPSSQFA
jgi:hypothetical protein